MGETPIFPFQHKNIFRDVMMSIFFIKFILAQGGKAESGEDAASYNLGKNYRNSVRRDADKVCSPLLRFFSLAFRFISCCFFTSLQLLCSLVPDCLSFLFFLALYLFTLICSFFLPISRMSFPRAFSSFALVFSLLS
jgi:hypothetical protein